MRPRCCFLYFTFLGINMALSLQVFGGYSSLAGGVSGTASIDSGAGAGPTTAGSTAAGSALGSGAGGAALGSSAAGPASGLNSCFQVGCGGANGGIIGAG